MDRPIVDIINNIFLIYFIDENLVVTIEFLFNRRILKRITFY